LAQTSDIDRILRAKCDLIYSLLHLLLLREHTHRRLIRIGSSEASLPKQHTDPAFPLAPTPPTQALLQLVIDLLQYEYFCIRVKAEMNKVVQILRRGGVPVKLHFDAVGENSSEVVESLIGNGTGRIGGVTVIRIDNRQVDRVQRSD
jgi:mediator of RNA polymerase II transcription subunit 17, fungi type